MKWLTEDPNTVNQTVNTAIPRTQDNIMVGYVVHRDTNTQEYQHTNMHATLPGKVPARWTLSSDQLIQPSTQEHMILMNNDMAMMAPHHPGLQFPPHIQQRQIAPAAKKLWGVEEQRDDKGLLHLSEHQMWRDSTWSTGDHTVSQPISMVPRRTTGFPDPSNMLSPRSSESGGLGVKMVEYVLATSPTSKDNLDTRMRHLVLNSNEVEKKEKEQIKSQSSPFEKKDEVNGQTNGHCSNGLVDDDKSFNRTPGSRQPSPAEEELNKNNLNVVQMPPQQMMAPHKPAPQLMEAVLDPRHEMHLQQIPNGLLAHDPQSHFDHHHHHHHQNMHGDPGNFDPGANYGNGNPQQGPPGSNANTGMDSPPPGVLTSHNFDIQQLFRSQQQQPASNTQPIQVLQQQQYLQQQAAAAQQQQLAFNTAPYVINPQEQYILAAGPTVVPQYYGVAPWGVYPASIIQQNAAAQQRRPLSPTSAAAADSSNIPQGQYIIPYYDQNGSIVMGNVRGIGNGTPMRLVSPAPVIVNAPTPGNSMRLLGNQSQQIATPPTAASLYSNSQASLYSTSATNGNATSSALGGGFPLGYANSAVGSPATISSLGSGLGLNSTSGRRDSFDRNTSAFSPSLDYNRGKWPTSYGALGTAAPSPLGLAGSLTPPPTLTTSIGSSQLGALMSNRVISAAPGAEAVAKYRNGLANATMFGSSSALLTKLTATARPTDKPVGRSRLLEDFRNNRFPSLTLRELNGHIVEFSQDQHGSRFIQQKLERATVAEKQMVFNEILPSAYNLMTDVFGNYVIQKFFEFGTPEQKATLAQKVKGHVLLLALQMYGCRVIQKALESVTPEQQQEVVRELDGHVLKCVKDQNGNHVVQKCIECVDPHALQFIINAFSNQVFTLSTHPYGCRVIQRILEHCTSEQTTPILEELHSHAENLVQDQYGNYVIQHVLEHGKPEDKSKIINNVRGKVLALSQHKFASNVVEKCVTHATRAERALLIEEVCNFNDNALQLMMRDQYANYVVQKMIDVCEHGQRKVLMHKIRGHISALRKYTYGKHIIAKLDKFFMKTPSVGVGAVGSELL